MTTSLTPTEAIHLKGTKDTKTFHVSLCSSCLCGVFLAVLVALAPFRAAAQKQPIAPTGVDLLRRVLQSESRIPFEARQTIVISENQAARATITREIHLGDGRSRIEFLAPQSAAGRLLILDGRWRWEYNPTRRTVVRSVLSLRGSTPSHIPTTLASVERSYRLRVEAPSSAIAGRSVWVLHLDPLHNDRHRRVWWVDRATALVLKREVYDPDGALETTSTYTEVNFHPPRDPALVAFTPPPGIRVISRSEPTVVTTLAEARRLAPAWARIPKTMGRGFDFESARLVTVKGAPGIHLRYSDGLGFLSLFQIQGKAAFPAGSRPVRTVRIGPRYGTLMQSAPFHILSWSAAGITFNLIADLADITMIDMARHLQ
jgi:outer membrane lipoprotein-sorting protein